jgi:branched-chain amino acid transport system ATP-binding protein
MTMLELAGVGAVYGVIKALEGVSLTVEPGQIVCLLGANGAGKTTTLNCISGMVELSGGTIRFEGERLDGLRGERIVARGIVQVPEGREIFPTMTTLDNLRLGAFLRRDRAAIARDLDWVFALFPRLRERLAQPAGTLSGGEQQMLMIGRALMAKPKLLMLDEPSLGLSPLLVQQVFATIRRINEQGISILVVEQNARIALGISARGYILENGELAMHGPSRELMLSPLVRAAYLGSGGERG